MDFKKLLCYAVKGLSPAYYFRNFILIAIIPVFLIYQDFQTPPLSIPNTLLLVISWLLYPYSRFVYESVMSFIMGNNLFFVNAFIMLLVKFITMALCLGFAIFIAPVGMLYLIYYHSTHETDL